MKKENNRELMETTPVSKAVPALAIPAMMSTIVYMVYNLTDTFFVGMLGDYNQISALTLSLPITWIISSVSGIFSAGASSYISRRLGEGDEKRVRAASSFVFYVTVLLSLILSLGALIFADPILRLAGAKDELFQITKDYTLIVLLGTAPGAASGAVQGLLSAEGRTKTASKAAVLGVLTNIALDPLFIFVFKMEIRGAAVATVLGSVASLIFCSLAIRKNIGSLSFKPCDFKPKKDIVLGVLSIGAVSSASTVAESISMMVVNVFAGSFGSYLVASVGVVVKLYSFGVSLIYGFAGGIQSFIGYNFGSKNFDRMKRGIFTAICYTTGITIVFFVIIFFFPNYLVGIFTSDMKVIETGVRAIRAFSLPLPFMGAQVCLFTFLIATGKAARAVILNTGKTLLLFIPLIFILTNFFGLNGLIFSYPISDIIYIVVTLFTVLPIILRLKNQKTDLCGEDRKIAA